MLEAIKQFIISNLGYIFTIFMVILTSIKLALVLVLFLVIIDAIVGIMASYKEKDKVSSRKFGYTFVKLSLYALALVVFGVLDKGINLPIFTYAGLTLILIREGMSIMENIDSILGTSFGKLIKNYLNRKDGTRAKDKIN